MEVASKRKNFVIVGLAALLVTAMVVISMIFFTRNQPRITQNPTPTDEVYRVVADADDGPEQIFGKAFVLYSNAHHINASVDEVRKVAEIMAEGGLRGKAYWTDRLGVRHELWIGTGDELVLTKDSATFNLSNAITDYKRKSVIIDFGFDDAYRELEKLRSL